MGKLTSDDVAALLRFMKLADECIDDGAPKTAKTCINHAREIIVEAMRSEIHIETSPPEPVCDPIPPVAIFEGGKIIPVETFEAEVSTSQPRRDTPVEERDSAGITWDASRHASSKAKNTDGTWRARRNMQADKPAPHQAETALSELESELSFSAVMGTTPEPIDPAFVPPPSDDSETEYDSYMARLEAVLAMENTDEWVTRVEMANLAVYGARPPAPGAFPEVRRLRCLGLVADKRAAVRSSPTLNAAPSTDFIALYDGMMKDIASWETVEKLDQWRNYGPVLEEFTNLKRGDEALYHKVAQAADAKRVTLELFEELKALALACQTMDEATKLQADKDYLRNVAIMHKADPTLWPKLRSVAMAHIEAIKAKGAA